MSDPGLPDAGGSEITALGGGVRVTLCPDGPLLVRGDFTLTDADGAAVEAGRNVVALCRCGASMIKPFCDGTHKVNGFRTDGR